VLPRVALNIAFDHNLIGTFLQAYHEKGGDGGSDSSSTEDGGIFTTTDIAVDYAGGDGRHRANSSDESETTMFDKETIMFGRVSPE
jgi:hypothetical protein